MNPRRPCLVVLPDTQYYSSRRPDIFHAQTDWVARHEASLNVAGVLHVGDLVDNPGDPVQWEVANSAMRRLDEARVPYVVVPGNHDTGAAREGLMGRYFSPRNMPWIAGTASPDEVSNSYALIDVGARKWVIVGLEFGPRDDVLAWAGEVLRTYRSLPAVVVTHAYLHVDGSRYDYAARGLSQAFAPRMYGYTTDQGINDGEDVWRKLVSPNLNVLLVFCGHDPGIARLTSVRGGAPVHQVLSDYQWSDELGGSGYLRLLTFDYDRREVVVETYSPYLDRYLTDDANQFTLDLGECPCEK